MREHPRRRPILGAAPAGVNAGRAPSRAASGRRGERLSEPVSQLAMELGAALVPQLARPLGIVAGPQPFDLSLALVGVRHQPLQGGASQLLGQPEKPPRTTFLPIPRRFGGAELPHQPRPGCSGVPSSDSS